MRPFLLLLLAVSLLAGPVLAEEEEETRYVTDTLRLRLYSEPDSASTALRTLKSGDALTVLEKRGRYARVRTEAGEEGWVKRTYLVKEPPAALRLAELQQQLEALQKQLAEREKRIAALEKQLKDSGINTNLLKQLEDKVVQLNQENVNLFNEKGKLRKQLEQAQLELYHLKNDRREADEDRARLERQALIGGGALLLGLLLGLYAGYRFYDRRIRRRFYGHRL